MFKILEQGVRGLTPQIVCQLPSRLLSWVFGESLGQIKPSSLFEVFYYIAQYPQQYFDSVYTSSATAWIARVGGHCAVQGHSRSSILAPIESPYATSY